MKVFVDTNVLIDLVCSRAGFVENAQRLFALGYMGNITLMLSSLSLVNTMYVAHKYGYAEVSESLKKISSFVDVVDLKGSAAVEALSSGWKDYEDAVQYQSSILSSAEYIVTRNKKDFSMSSIPVYTVEEFLQISR